MNRGERIRGSRRLTEYISFRLASETASNRVFFFLFCLFFLSCLLVLPIEESTECDDDNDLFWFAGNVDIVNGNLKLILGLIWSLIVRYQIGKSKFPPRKLMLAWLKVSTRNCTVDLAASRGRNLDVEICNNASKFLGLDSSMLFRCLGGPTGMQSEQFHDGLELRRPPERFDRLLPARSVPSLASARSER